jgi:hypothetical protein
MITAENKVREMINASARIIDARVELYEGSPTVDAFNETLLDVYQKDDHVKEIKIERVGEQSKFFGFGICQKLSVTLTDKDREINIEKDHILESAFGVDGEYTYPYPLFRVETVSRDETNNDLSVVAYDFLYKAGEHRVSEIEMTGYTIREFVYACANILGLPVKIELDEAESYVFDTYFEKGANFEGTETIRQALDDVAEATQTIYYVDWDWQLTFKRLDKYSQPEITVDKSKYFNLTNKGEKTLATICHATELGDNISHTEGEGVIQYVRDNAFWELRDDAPEMVGNAVMAMAGTSIHQINLTWRGNWLLEIGDQFAIVTKDNERIYCYLLNDTVTYNGGYQQVTTWSFTEHTGETASNPITIGDAINQTVAKVDKVNKQIELVVSETGQYSDRIAQIEMTTDEIQASVSRVESNVTSSIDGVNETIDEIRNEVETKVSSTDVTILVEEIITTGIDSVTTSTGFTFDAVGLTIDKSNSELSTQITEDGMTVYRNSTPVLVANNQGVDAVNLHATTYLIIGDKSRFENYGDRTGCFWIG